MSGVNVISDMEGKENAGANADPDAKWNWFDQSEFFSNGVTSYSLWQNVQFTTEIQRLGCLALWGIKQQLASVCVEYDTSLRGKAVSRSSQGKSCTCVKDRLTELCDCGAGILQTQGQIIVCYLLSAF